MSHLLAYVAGVLTLPIGWCLLEWWASARCHRCKDHGFLRLESGFAYPCGEPGCKARERWQSKSKDNADE